MCIVSTQDWKQHNLIMVAGDAFVLPGCSSYCSRILNCLFVCPGVVDDERLWSKSWLDRLPQHPTGSLHCAQCKSHTDQLNNTNAHNKTLQWSLECFVCFSSSFFFSWFCCSTLFYHFFHSTTSLCCPYIFSSSIVNVWSVALNTQRLWQCFVSASECSRKSSGPQRTAAKWYKLHIAIYNSL